MEKVRVGIIGMGNVGRHHASYMVAGKVNRCELVAVAGRSPELPKSYPSLKVFENGEEMIASGELSMRRDSDCLVS